MNSLPPKIIDKIFIPKYLDRKYDKYSLQFKMDIYHTSQKYKNVVNEFNRNIDLFYKENLFNYLSNLNYLNYFYKLFQLSLTEFNINKVNYNTHYKKSYENRNFILPNNNNKFFTINGFVVKNEELSELWEKIIRYW